MAIKDRSRPRFYLPFLALLLSTAANAFDITASCESRGIAYENLYRRAIGRSAPGTPEEAREIMTRVLSQAVALKRIPGGVIAFGGDFRGETVSFWTGTGTLSKGSSVKVDETTLYDIASLSKVVSTATCIHLLVDRGKIDLNSPISNYIPELARTRLGEVALKRFMRHRGGTRDIAVRSRADFLARIAREGFDPQLYLRDEFRYTDAAYVLLGEVVERVSGTTLDRFAADNIFLPLEMTHTGYRPAAESPCARTLPGVANCRVHDPISNAFGGVAGNAGVFSTAGDLARFAQMLLDRGKIRDATGVEKTFLSAEAVQAMTSDPEHLSSKRGLGFDITSPYACSSRGRFPIGSFGHTGYTGTSLWVDPASRRFVVLLTNEVEIGKGPIDAIRWNAASTTARIKPVDGE